MRTVVATGLALALAGFSVAGGFGVNAHIPLDPQADLMAEAGIGWVRVDVLWSIVEPERDVYDWRIYDELVDRLEARGVRIYAGFGATPAWATAGPEFSGVPEDPRQWQELCYLAAARYAGRVDAWGIWNEPNLDRFWVGTRQQYIEDLLLPGAAAIALADPSALVVAPDLAHLSSAHWEDWLYESVSAARDLIDVVAHHNYPSDALAEEVTYDLQEGGPFWFSPPAVREVLQDAGWWGLPFWLTETGVESREHGVGTQAGFVSDLLGQWFGIDRGNRNWVDRIFFYELNDGPDPSQYTFGIAHGPPGYDPKPAYTAYADFIAAAQVNDAELVGHTLPRFVEPADKVNASVELLNTGTLEWSFERGTELFVYVEGGGLIVEVEQLGPGETVPPGAAHRFALRFVAPEGAGPSSVLSLDLRVRLLSSDLGAFGDALRHEVTVTELEPPRIDAQPVAAWALPGRSTSLRVSAGGDGPLAYRWLRNGAYVDDGGPYSGADTPVLAIAADGPEVAAFYVCEVSSPAGVVVSAPIEVVYGAPPPRGSGGRVEPDGVTTRPLPETEGVRLTGPPATPAARVRAPAAGSDCAGRGSGAPS
ncbi:MAG: beta-galactosidase [Thermoanaerobaculales bacterium]|jgi:hypothetical protein|nr:beta-galactosidase [Thermoanaerobaculales bacterium]